MDQQQKRPREDAAPASPKRLRHSVPVHIFYLGLYWYLDNTRCARDRIVDWLRNHTNYDDVTVDLLVPAKGEGQPKGTAWFHGYGDAPFAAARRAVGAGPATDPHAARAKNNLMFQEVKEHNGFAASEERRQIEICEEAEAEREGDALEEDRLQHQPGDREGPDERRHAPAPEAAEGDHVDGRDGAGDHRPDGRVIEALEHVPRDRAPVDQVVGAAEGEERHGAEEEDAEARARPASADGAQQPGGHEEGRARREQVRPGGDRVAEARTGDRVGGVHGTPSMTECGGARVRGATDILYTRATAFIVRK